MTANDPKQPINLIYIVGVSFSGSSLLGFLLGAPEAVENLGDLKLFDREQRLHKMCTCGLINLNCPFWSKYYQAQHLTFDQPSMVSKLTSVLKIILKGRESQNQIIEASDFRLLAAISEDFKSKDKSKKYFLDTSKNIWRLMHLYNCKGINLKVIYLKRGIEANVTSFEKHGEGFWLGLFTYKAQHFLIKRLLNVNNIPFCMIRHEEVCADLNKVVREAGEFLEVDYSNLVEKVKNRKYHVQSGNWETRRQFMVGFQRIKQDDSWKQRLTKAEKLILRILDRG